MSSPDDEPLYSSPKERTPYSNRRNADQLQYQYNSDSSGSDFEAGHLYPKKSEDESGKITAPTPRKGQNKHPPPPVAPPSHARASHQGLATSPLTEPDMNSSQYESGSSESEESDDDDIDFSPDKGSIKKKEPFFTPKQQQGKGAREIDPVSDSEKLAVASQPTGTRLSPAGQSNPSPIEYESSSNTDNLSLSHSNTTNTQSTAVGNKRDKFASTASKGTSERTIDVFLDDLQQSGASDSDPTRTPHKQQLSRDASLKSIDTRSTTSSINRNKSYRTPQFGNKERMPNSGKGLEMKNLRTHGTPMTEISLTDTPGGQSNKMAQSLAASNASSFRGTKRTFRRPYAKKNELGWRQSHSLRKWCIISSDSMAWEIGVLLLIVGNCVTLAMASPLDDPESSKVKVLSGIEWFFSVAFTIELVTKIIAMGYFTDENAYMRDNWNILDFIIVMFGWVSEISGGGGGLTAMRAMRVLRPLRTIKGIPELKRIIEGMISSIPQLSTVFGLCAGVYILFGILGMQLFSGKMSQRCQDTTTLEWDMDSGRFCSMEASYGRQCPDGSVCGDSGVSLNDNITSFDDIFKAFLTVFQSCTLEGWVDAMYCLMDTMPSAIPGLYFVILIWVGSLFLLNLVTVVVYISYSDSADKIAELSDSPGEGDDLAKDLETVTSNNLTRTQENAKTLALQAVDDLNMALLNNSSRPEGLRQRKGDGDGEGDGEEAREQPPLLDGKSMRFQAVQLSEVASLLNAAVNQLVSIPNVIVHSHNHADDKNDDMPDYSKSPGRYICYQLVQSTYFQALMNFLIIFNTGCLASEHYGQSDEQTDFLATANVWFTFVFTFEIYAKLKGLGMDKFKEDTFNTFDSAIVFISLIELMVGGEGGGGISALRSFRIIRLFKLLRSWVTLRRILKNMAMTMNSSSSFIGLLMLMIFVFSLVGMTMFGNTFDKECEEDSTGATVCYAPRANYDSMFTSAIVSFQIMTMENWNEVLYIGILSNGIVAALFIILNLLIGGFLMMNIFLAILIDNYSEAVHEEIEKAKEKERRHREKEKIRGILEKGGSSQCGQSRTGDPAELEQLLYDSEDSDPPVEEESEDEEEEAKVIIDEDAGAWELFKDPSLHLSYKYNSMCLFGSGSKIRHAAYKLVLWPWFDRFILSLIIFNCLTLALNQPGAKGLGPQGSLGEALEVLDSIFTYTFICEFVFKLVAFGLILHPGSYSRNSWNLLDGFIVITSFIELGSGGGGDSNMGSLRALRALRALRPLRLISRLEGLQIVINTMLRAFKPCASVASVALVFYTVFSIVGINLFGGRFYSCTDPFRTCFPDAPGMTADLCPTANACIGNWTNPDSGLVEAREWANPTYEETGTTYSFDNFFTAMLTLFEVASLEMWPSVMYSANDITDVGLAPTRNNKEGNSLFFVLFISIMTFFVMELFVTVIIDNFNEIKSERDGSAYMTDKQIDWVRTQKQLATRKPKNYIAPPPEDQKTRLALFHVVTGEKFEMFIMGFIVVNTVFMMMEYKGQGDGWTLFLSVMNYIFAFVFTVEMVLKWFAMGTPAYFGNGWNKFDSIIVTMTLISMVLDWCSVELPFDPTLLRVGRIARVFRIIKSSQSLKAITQTIFLSLPSMGNVGMVLALIFFIFAIAGMGIFGGMEKGDFINTWCNFDTFWMSIVTLFRCATGESWNGLMHDAMKHSQLAVFYFAFFQLVASYVLLNLFVAIILDQMSDQMEAVKEQATQLKQFSNAWKQAKLASVGGDVMSLAVNSSALLTKSMDDNELKRASSGAVVNPTAVTTPNRRRSMTESIKDLLAKREAAKKARWAKKEKNVHFLPAFYLKKLIRSLPSPLGMAELQDVMEETISKTTGRKEVVERQDVKEATNPSYEVLQFIRECDIPIVDGAWVEYKEVLHAVFFRATRKANEDDEDFDESGSEGGTEWFHLRQFQRNMPLEHDGKRYESDIPNDEEAEQITSSLSRMTVSAEDHKNSQRFTADEWFACVVMQAWFRGSRGRIKVEGIKEERRRTLSQKDMHAHLGDVGALMGGKKKKKKKKDRTHKSQRREGGMGRKYNIASSTKDH